jgi:acyl carrier protein
MSIEDEFSVEVPDEAIDDIKVVGDLVKFIEENM